MKITEELSSDSKVFTNELSQQVFKDTYSFGGETPDGMFNRVAETLSKVEHNQLEWKEKFYDLLTDFKFVPGGRILSNAGIPVNGTTMINCFVDGFQGKNRDSMDGIMETLHRQSLILKSEGGYGFCADTMRPRGGFINGIANESPGAVRMLDMWDTQSSVITAGSGKKSQNKFAKGKIRKGAQMVTMSIWHPDVVEFIEAKQTPGRLTKFNMSVLITDEFMKAVKNHKPWDLMFPDFDGLKEIYDEEWDGDLNKWIKKGYQVKIYKTYDDANELWDIIMKSTYNRNEPGVLFADTINRMNNLQYCEYISATNPCGEQMLPTGGVCLLGSFNLTQFVNQFTNRFDFDKLGEYIPIAVRMLDNVNDTTYVPLYSQKENLKNKRRIGMGVMGLASTLMMLKIRYGSQESLEFIETLMSFIANKAYQSSSKIAAEKGSFLLYDEEKYLQSEFLKNLSDETVAMIKQNGIRNSHLLSIQPTGNSSTLANVVSSGLEPIFLQEYIRTAIVPHTPDGLDLPKNIDYQNKFADDMGEWEWIKEGDENLLMVRFGGEKYKLDFNRGLTKEHLVTDYGVKFLKDLHEYDPDADWCVDTSKLDIHDHVGVMKVMSKYIDSAMSKTVNLPSDYSFEDFKELYTLLHESGTIKGGTTYRDGTMTSVLSSVKDEKKGITKTTAPKRPVDLECDVHHLTVKGEWWIVVVGLYESEPYEVFGFKQNQTDIPKSFKNGILRKLKKGHYELIDLNENKFGDITSLFDTAEEEALTRMISTALRHGADIKFVVEQLNKSQGTVIEFSKAIARTLKKYLGESESISITCESCEGTNIAMEDGCYKCLDCGSSKCS